MTIPVAHPRWARVWTGGPAHACLWLPALILLSAPLPLYLDRYAALVKEGR